ncbi:MAG TPA: response regulator transcription factor [Nitrospiria bacterium]|nr:response regulator transcription factor [Nitrospiria bacterium]
MAKKIRVLIADDHQVVRDGLSAILQTKDDIVVVGEAKDGVEAVEKTKQLQPDVVLMDISMPRMTGVEATRKIKEQCPSVRVVVLTMYEEEEYIFDLVKTGVAGYLLKNSDSAQIVKAIRSAAKGESFLHPTIAGKILTEFTHMAEGRGKKPAKGKSDLTEREQGVLQYIAEGKTNKEIANALSISEKTVKNHVRNIFHKLDVYDRTQAAIQAIRRGIIRIDMQKS